MYIKYIDGDVTSPKTKDGIIAHIVNDVGAFGMGVSKAISNAFPMTEQMYREWYRTDIFDLGQNFYISVSSTNTLYVCHMVAQKGLRSSQNPSPLDYYALAQCLFNLYNVASMTGLAIHMPRIGSGLAGSDWNKIEEIIENNATLFMVDTYIYDLPTKE